MKWNDLTMRERSDLMSLFLKAGVSSLSDMKHIYDGTKDTVDTVDKVNKSSANFVERLKDPNRKFIQDWVDPKSIATHKLGAEYDENGIPFIYPNVQEIDGKLVDFTRPPYHSWAGYDSAIERKDTVQTKTLQEAIDFTENYKKYYPKGHTFSGEENTASIQNNWNIGYLYSKPLDREEIPIPLNQQDDSYTGREVSELPLAVTSGRKYKILDFPAEREFTNKANDIIDKNRKETTTEQVDSILSKMSKEKLQEQQRILANEGLFDKTLSKGKSSFAGELQKVLIKKGYLDKSEQDNNIGKNTITALQSMLVDKGYLSEYAENGKRNIDGLIGERTQKAFKDFWRDYNVDGYYGNRTKKAYVEHISREANPFKKEISAKGMVDQCAAWVSKKFDSVVGNTKQNGVYGDAWNMLKNIEDSGGNIIFNIYDSPEFDNVKTPKELRNKTNISLREAAPDYSQLMAGDIVGIYMPTSSHMTDAIETGTTYNTHVGMVVGEEDGVPIIEHNILGKVRRERIDRLTGSIGGKPMVTVAARPKNTVSVHGTLPFDDSIKSDLEVEIPLHDKEGNDRGTRRINNSLFSQYKDALAQSKSAFKELYPDVDGDFIEKAAIAVLGRETFFMEHKQSDYRKIKDNPGSLTDFVSAQIRKKAVNLLKEPEIQSRDLTKMKYSSVPSYIRKAIGLESPEQLDTNPILAGRAAYAILARNYDYFKRLSEEYPEFGLTKTDIENATIQSYNSGMGSGLGYSLGFDENSGDFDASEIELLRKRGTKGYKEKDPSSTNYPYLGKLGKKLVEFSGYNGELVANPTGGLGTLLVLAEDRLEKKVPASTPYVGRAREYMQNIIKKK